jgi:hypothetical protein
MICNGHGSSLQRPNVSGETKEKKKKSISWCPEHGTFLMETKSVIALANLLG